jgi:hypothetical protein
MKILYFILGCIPILKESTYTYIGIPLSNNPLLKPIIAFMESKVQKSLYTFSSFLNQLADPFTF